MEVCQALCSLQCPQATLQQSGPALTMCLLQLSRFGKLLAQAVTFEPHIHMVVFFTSCVKTK
ncbi:hypothetical protein KBTX_01964 [wastewater metagenome]|uniref:Uncharacterized protein n=2 Tax=unclassified sequences TaxID=12908 RepID=A0A5B8RAL1_9ZZZZ|nr:hypothetical protein KBTEX_01964 [uncultured organism]